MSTTDARDKVDEIKERLDIVEVISKTVNLHPTGGNTYAGSVGTTGHSGESLKVDGSGQVFKDFKNGKGGDVFDWIGHVNGLDARGTDFPEVLRIAADLAGVELEGMTEEERNSAKEKADIHNLFTAAAETYHKNLTPELYDHIFSKWGITPETVDRFKIGYSRTDRNLNGLDKATLKKSGLVFVNGGMIGGEIFRGRIIFPYWKNGKVVYLIGRQTEETPRRTNKATGKDETPKYQKLLVHKEGREYVSPSVQNSYFYGEDSVRGADYCVITEGVADCIAMLQAGFPCISPVTVQFREKDNPKLISLAKGLSRVYICNDNEANKAGLKGALNTAEALEEAGIETRLITLPKPDGVDKIDIADYMKEHNREDFNELLDSSIRLWDFKLNQVEIKASLTSVERLRAFRTFISKDLRGMDQCEWEMFVSNEVAGKFRLNKKDIKTTIDGCARERVSKTTASEQEPEPEDGGEDEDRLKTYPEEIRELAYQILKEGDAFSFILETWNLRHVGDKNLGENCLCSVASTYVLTSDMGLHVKPSGESGKGKSDAMQNVLNLLPEHKFISGSLSGKALFYDPNLNPGTIIYSDDAHLNEDIIATIKQSTSDFQAVTEHRTVVNGEFKHYFIPERCGYWFSSVDGIGDDQLANRFLNADVDGSATQDERVFDHINDKEGRGYSTVDDDVLICRCIFDILGKEQYIIKIPFTKAIDWKNKQNRRNYQKFLDIIRAVTFFNVCQRRNINGTYLADIEDFERAVDIYTGTSKNNATNLTSQEIEVLKFIAGKNKYDDSGKTTTIIPTTKPELMKKFNISAGRAHHILHGRDGRGGMLAKVAQLSKVDKSITTGDRGEDKVTTKQNEYTFTGRKIGLEIYDTVATINESMVSEVETEFMKTLEEETVTNCYPAVTQDKVTVKKNTVDRIRCNVTQKIRNKTGTKVTHASEQLKENMRAKNNPPSHSEKLGNSATVDEKKSHPSSLSNCGLEGNNEVTVGNSSAGDESADASISGLLRRALITFAKEEYNGTVSDIDEFTRNFNKKVPEYKKALGQDAIGYNANRLHVRGWR